MRQWYGSLAAIAAFVRNRVNWRTREENRLFFSAGLAGRRPTRAALANDTAMVDDFRQVAASKLTLPTVTFSDRLTLHLDDLTLNLAYYGQAHRTGHSRPRAGAWPSLGGRSVRQRLPSPGVDRRPANGTWAFDASPTGDAAVQTVVGGHLRL